MQRICPLGLVSENYYYAATQLSHTQVETGNQTCLYIRTEIEIPKSDFTTSAIFQLSL